MSEKSKPKRLSETVKPGIDYPQKVKLADLLDRDVLVLAFEAVEGAREYGRVDAETGELVLGEYWNVEVEDQGLQKTFCTGAIPIDKVFRALQQKIVSGEAELPLLATFRKEGRTFVIS